MAGLGARSRGKPRAVDLAAVGSAPISKALELAGWEVRSFPVASGGEGSAVDEGSTLMIHEAVSAADFLWATMVASPFGGCPVAPGGFVWDEDLGIRSRQFPMGRPGVEGAGREELRVQNEVDDFLRGQACRLAQMGGEAVRAAPLSSAAWASRSESSSEQSVLRWDTRIWACVYQAARRWILRMRHNVEEISAWPVVSCAHAHDPRE